MRLILGFFYGVIYGAAHVVPGLSGGTFLVIFGCYDLICEAFALNFKEIKKNLPFLICFGVGTVGGLIGFVFAAGFLFDNFEVQTSLFFTGLILGGLPLIFHLALKTPEKPEISNNPDNSSPKINAYSKFAPKHIAPFALGLGLVLILFFLEKFGATGNFETAANANINLFFTLKIIFCAFLAAVAMVAPGISGAFILVAFGVYELFVTALKELNLSVVIPAIIGIILGIVIGAKIILALLKKYKLGAYSAIIGMVIGSVAPAFPKGFGANTATLTGLIAFVAGLGLAYGLGKREFDKSPKI